LEHEKRIEKEKGKSDEKYAGEGVEGRRWERKNRREGRRGREDT